MDLQTLTKYAEEFIQRLCIQIPTRHLGSEGNRLAASFFDDWMLAQGMTLEQQHFECQDWEGEGASLTVAGETFTIFPSPHSLGCQVTAPLIVATTLDELNTADARGQVLLLRGPIASTQLMPTNFPFYYPDEHRTIFEALEAAQPAAILTATAPCPQIAGAQYPLQMIEDGNFDLPSVYLTEEEGERLASYTGQTAVLVSHARRIPSHGWNSIARLNPAATQRIVLCAHIDTKPNTPGALDNAAGITTLMLLGWLLAQESLRLSVEIVSLNGEDHYAAKGETVYLEAVRDRLEEIALVVNLDGLGFIESDTAYSLYGCPEDLAALIKEIMRAHPGLLEDDAWYQGDHTMFIQQGLPALALTSADLGNLLNQITHTPADSPEKVDPRCLANVALALRNLLKALDKHLAKGVGGLRVKIAIS